MGSLGYTVVRQGRLKCISRDMAGNSCGSCLAIGASAIAALTVDSRPICVQAEEWVSRHADRLPTTLDAVAALPTAYQKRIFSALPAEAKVRLWHERLARIRQLPLTREQQDVVADAFAIVTPGLYNGGLVPEEWLARRASAFSAKDARDLFETLGTAQASFSSLDALTVSLRAQVNGFSTVGAAPSCSCNGDEDCGGGQSCSIEVCNFVPSGCGPFGTSECAEGVCRSR